MVMVKRYPRGRWLALALLSLLALMMPKTVLANDALWSELRNGGIVLFRHALAPGTGDPSTFTLNDCSTQRNLNDVGRADAVRIGTIFREKAIPVSKVLTSQWCRCRETAILAFPDKPQDAPIFNSFFRDRSTEPEQSRDAKALLQNWAGPGALVVVTHQVNITALTGIFPASGEGIVVRIDNKNVTVVGRLRL